MSVRLGLLGLLKDRPSHGYDLKLRYDHLLDPDRPVQPAQVYATLNRLERDGLVEVAARGERGGGPERRTYKLTREGEDALYQWLDEPVEPVPHLHTLLFTKVVLTLLSQRSVDELVDRQREAHLVRMRELTGLRQARNFAIGLLADYALLHLEADMRWLDLSSARIRDNGEQLTRQPTSRRSP